MACYLEHISMLPCPVLYMFEPNFNIFLSLVPLNYDE